MAGTLAEIRIPSQPVHSFTATEVAAAELLLQLSESSGTGGGVGGGGGDSSSSFSSSSPRSVNAMPPPVAMVVGADEEEEYEIGGAPRRLRPRYRLIADLYAVTVPIEGDEKRSGEAGQRGEKRTKGGE